MIFMFIIVFNGWIPIYLAAIINWNDSAFSYVAFTNFRLLPPVKLLIAMINLCWYNHELCSYLEHRFKSRRNPRTILATINN